MLITEAGSYSTAAFVIDCFGGIGVGSDFV